MKGTRAVTISAWIVVAAGIGLAMAHYFGGSPDDPEGWLSAVGFAAPFIGVGMLALIGIRWSRLSLCTAAGAALAVMSVVSIVLFPLLIAAGIMVWTGLERDRRTGWVVVPLTLGLALVCTFGFVLLHQDPASWTTPDGGGSSSDIVTNSEALISIAIVSGVLMAGSFWARKTGLSIHHPVVSHLTNPGDRRTVD